VRKTPRRSEKFGLGFNIGGICSGLLIIVAGICNMVWNIGRELKKIKFSPPSKCPIDLFGPLAN